MSRSARLSRICDAAYCERFRLYRNRVTKCRDCQIFLELHANIGGISQVITIDELPIKYKLLNTLKKQFGELEIYQHSDVEPAKPFCAGLDQDIIDSLNAMYNGKD